MSQQKDPAPDWAVQQATDELYDVDDAALIEQRAQEIARHARQLHRERHDEYDDPDEGGEG
jgi:hypothetical protein